MGDRRCRARGGAVSASSVTAQIVVVRDCEWVRFPDLGWAPPPERRVRWLDLRLGPHLDALSGNLESFWVRQTTMRAMTSVGGRRLLGRLTVSALSALVVISCASPARQRATDSQPAGGGVERTWGPLAVVPGAGGEEALIEGSLRVGDRCVLLDERGEDVLLIWPADRTRWDADSGTITFESTGGEIVTLGDGDHVAFGGGGSSVEEGGQSAGEFVAGLDWVSPPAPECVLETRWFVNELVE